MRYKVGDMVKVNATREQLNEIDIFTDVSLELYSTNRFFRISRIANPSEQSFGAYCLEELHWFPENFIHTREDKLKRILYEI